MATPTITPGDVSTPSVSGIPATGDVSTGISSDMGGGAANPGLGPSVGYPLTYGLDPNAFPGPNVQGPPSAPSPGGAINVGLTNPAATGFGIGTGSTSLTLNLSNLSSVLTKLFTQGLSALTAAEKSLFTTALILLAVLLFVLWAVSGVKHRR